MFTALCKYKVGDQPAHRAAYTCSTDVKFYISAQTFSHARRNDGITPRTSVSHVIVSPFGKVYTCCYDEAMTAPMRQAGEY